MSLALGEKFTVVTKYGGKEAVIRTGGDNYFPIARDNWYPNNSTGGLGEYIYRGLSMVDTTVILAGAVPAAGLALAVDAVLLWTEKQLSARRRSKSRRVAVTIAAIAAHDHYVRHCGYGPYYGPYAPPPPAPYGYGHPYRY